MGSAPWFNPELVVMCEIQLKYKENWDSYTPMDLYEIALNVINDISSSYTNNHKLLTHIKYVTISYFCVLRWMMIYSYLMVRLYCVGYREQKLLSRKAQFTGQQLFETKYSMSGQAWCKAHHIR